jgi:hypothetical protein
VGLAAELIKEGSGQELDYRRIGRAGDQSFWGVGIPSMFDTFSEQSATDTPTAAAAKALSGGGKRGGGFGWWWHTTEDTLDKVDPDNLLRDARIYAAGLWELCTQPALPIDYAAAAREIHDRLEHYQEVAGDRLDLSSPIAHASDAVSHLERVNELKSSADDVKRLNRSIVKIGHALVPINYTKVGPFDHDLALNVTAVPALAGVAKLAELDPGSTEMRSLQARLVRERNRVSAALMEAVGVAEGAA